MINDEQLSQIAYDVDAFIIKEIKDFNINSIDLSAIINSRLRAVTASEGMAEDFESLTDHLISQTVILPTQIH